MTRKNSLGFIKLRPPTSPEGQSLLGPIWPCYQGQFEYYLVQILTIKLWPQKNTTFYNVVTIFFSLQRKLIEKKNYLFKNSCPEEITPPIPLDQSSLDHLSAAATAAKPLQSCPTLSDPMDCSLPGSSIRGIFPGKTTGVGCHCLLCILH